MSKLDNASLLRISLSHAHMKAASSLDLLDSARARGRSGEFLSKLEANHACDMADLEVASRAFVEAYLKSHASFVSDGGIMWKTPLDD